MRFLLLLSLVSLTGCAVNSAFEPPVVDMTGVNLAKHQADQNECVARRRANDGLIVAGAPITECMRDKGYTILAPKS